MKYTILLILSILVIDVSGTTLEVNLDGSAEYTVVQEAIQASANGDTILVYPEDISKT